MSTPLNREIRDYRVRIQQYRRVLRVDKEIKEDEDKNPDGRPLLSDDEIQDINQKIDSLEERLGDLLRIDDDCKEVMN